MPNPIKYNASAETLALQKGNFWIGTGAVGKGPTSTTGYYNGITPPSGGYTLYLNKASGGPSIYCPANDAALISLTNSIAGASYTTAQQCFNYYYTQTDKMCLSQDYPVDFPYIVLDGLVLYVDAGITLSYPGSGTTWTDINGLGPKNNGTLTNGPTYSSANSGSIVFDGVDDVILWPNNPLSALTSAKTYDVWVKFDNSIVNTFTISGGTYMVYLESKNTWFVNQTGASNSYLSWTFSTGWTNFVYSFDGTNHLCYINGVAKTINFGSGLSSQTNLYIGNRIQMDSPMKGNIATTRVYSRGLSASEILQNYNSTKSRFGL